MENISRKYVYIYLCIFILLSMSTWKIFNLLRVGQLFIVFSSGILLAKDLVRYKSDMKIIMFFIIGATAMTVVSLSSLYTKIGELNFIIKYFIVFPATFYVGAKAVEKLEINNLIFVMEGAVFVYASFAYLIYAVALPPSILDMFVHYREGFGDILYLDFQGTFFEAGWYALAVGSALIGAMILRYEFHIWPPKQSIFLFIFYFMSVTSLFLSKNKTIWIALISIALILAIYSLFKSLLYLNWYQSRFFTEEIMERYPVLLIKPLRIIFIVLIAIIMFYFINESLQNPIITQEMINEKMRFERGKALDSIIHLLKQSDWVGGYGFGFIEYYYSEYWLDIIGLGEGTNMVFNSYLDIWLSVSFVGLFYHAMLLYISSSGRYYFTMIIPLFFFIFANFNPAVGDEYYYLFLGISYGLIQRGKIVLH